MKNRHLFTPRIKTGNSWIRLKMELNSEDITKIGRGHNWSAIVTNQKSGKMYHAKAASCGLPRCFCDAIVTERGKP